MRNWGWWRPFSIPPFERPATDLTEGDRAWLLNEAAHDLRALGRLGEAVVPMRAVLVRDVKEKVWKEAAISATNLSELQLALGEVAEAVTAGKAAIEYADLSGDMYNRMVRRTTLAEAKHQAGERATAQALFEEAEAMQAELQSHYPWLYSLRGYQYCDLMLALGRAPAVRERGEYALEIARKSGYLVDIALNYLSLGRVASALRDLDEARRQLDQAVDGLREAGYVDHLARGLLARAALFREVEEFARSRRDLDEAMRIAERGGMRLHQCDAHLGYARLALAEGRHDDAREHLRSAKTLVRECGYGRRKGEAEELEKALA